MITDKGGCSIADVLSVFFCFFRGKTRGAVLSFAINFDGSFRNCRLKYSSLVNFFPTLSRIRKTRHWKLVNTLFLSFAAAELRHSKNLC